MDTTQIGNRAWGYAHVLRDDGLSYMEYVEQLTLLLFLKMADQRTKAPYNQPPLVPEKLGWKSLLRLDGPELEVHYRHILEELGKKRGMLGVIFQRARCEIQNPATLKQLIVNLIDKVDWVGLPVDVKGTIYEELLQRSAAESTKGAGQYSHLVRLSRLSARSCSRRRTTRSATRRPALAAFSSLPITMCWRGMDPGLIGMRNGPCVKSSSREWSSPPRSAVSVP